jgi:16S rRNA (cytosine967-C5)-methyltransferase
LDNAVACLKLGGRIVYSTCSIEAQENQEQIDRFLADHPNFKLIDTREALPFKDGTDGAFAARLERSQ